MSTTQQLNKEEAHRNTVSEMIGKCTDDELHQDMKDTEYTYRQLRISLLVSFKQMKQIHKDFDYEDDSNLTALRDIMGSVRAEEIARLEMISSQCEFDNKAGA